jgi:hypothetical protein
MPILFEDVLQPQFNDGVYPGRGECWQRLNDLVASHDAFHMPERPPWPRFSDLRRIRQLDKDEPVVTYYLIAALNRASDGFSDGNLMLPLLKRAFRSGVVAEQVFEYLSNRRWDGLSFEAPASPSPQVVTAVQNAIPHHPIAYVREFAQAAPVGYEGETIFDAYVGAEKALRRNATGATGLGVEVKFTSDISGGTTYSPHRNQIIRNVEVGNSHFANFFYLFISPRQFRDERSRFYVYKLEEYIGPGGAEALRRDSLTKPCPCEASRWQKHIGWLDVEDIVEAIFPGGAVGDWHPDARTFVDFLISRRLWPFPGQPGV